MALTTDVTPRISLTPAQVQQDEYRVKRLKAALCPGIFSHANEEAATQILEDLLKICGGSTETLSGVLQTGFFAGHTPFYWLIAKRHSTPGTPPLFRRLLSVCESLSDEAQKEIAGTFYKEYDSDLYMTVKPKLGAYATNDAYSTSEFFASIEDRPVVTHSGTNGTPEFRIPKFFDRVMVDEDVSIMFLSHERMWRLTAAVVNPACEIDAFSWGFSVVEMGVRPHQSKKGSAAGLEWFQIHIDLGFDVDEGHKFFGPPLNHYNTFSTKEFSSKVTSAPQPFSSTNLEFTQFYSDRFTSSSNRQLQGKIRIVKRVR